MCVSASARSLRPLRIPHPSLPNHHIRFAHTSKNPSCGTCERLTADRATCPMLWATQPVRQPTTHRSSCAHCHQCASSLTRRAHKCRSRTPRAVTLRRKGRPAFDGSPGQVRPYVRPVTRLWSRWPSWVCAYVSGTNLYGVLEGTETNPVLPELSLTTAFPITLLSVSRRGSSQACA
jgi:hypothetical protein